jgi:hypothetical protein
MSRIERYLGDSGIKIILMLRMDGMGFILRRRLGVRLLPVACGGLPIVTLLKEEGWINPPNVPRFFHWLA